MDATIKSGQSGDTMGVDSSNRGYVGVRGVDVSTAHFPSEKEFLDRRAPSLQWGTRIPINSGVIDKSYLVLRNMLGTAGQALKVLSLRASTYSASGTAQVTVSTELIRSADYDLPTGGTLIHVTPAAAGTAPSDAQFVPIFSGGSASSAGLYYELTGAGITEGTAAAELDAGFVLGTTQLHASTPQDLANMCCALESGDVLVLKVNVLAAVTGTFLGLSLRAAEMSLTGL